MKQKEMKKQILQVLDDWQDSQLNIKSESGRGLLAEALVQKLIRSQNIKLAVDEIVPNK